MLSKIIERLLALLFGRKWYNRNKYGEGNKFNVKDDGGKK
jgi:hypothetical protein